MQDLYEMTVGELLMALKGCRERLSFMMWKQAYLIAMACLSKEFPSSHEDANPELIQKPTVHVEDWVIKGAKNYVGT